MKKTIKTYSFIFLIGIVLVSCKKENYSPAKTEVKAIDYDSRQGIPNVQIGIYNMSLDIAGNAHYSTSPDQILTTGFDGRASFEPQFGLARFSVSGYLPRLCEMFYLSGDIEMLKSAEIELKLVNANLIPGDNLTMAILCKPNFELSGIYGISNILFQQDITSLTGTQVYSFQGAAGKINLLDIAYASTINSQRVEKDTVFQVIPALSGTTHVEFRY